MELPQSCGRNGVNYLSLFHYSMIQGSFFMRMHCGARHCLCPLVMYWEGNLGTTAISSYWNDKIIEFDCLLISWTSQSIFVKRGENSFTYLQKKCKHLYGRTCNHFISVLVICKYITIYNRVTHTCSRCCGGTFVRENFL